MAVSWTILANGRETVRNYEYRVLNYAPTPTSEHEAVCLVIVKEPCLNIPNKLMIYAPAEWSDEILSHHFEYILDWLLNRII